MVNSGKDRAVSITNMDLVTEDLDEKLRYPFCIVWPTNNDTLKIHKLENGTTEYSIDLDQNSKRALISKFLTGKFLSKLESIEINSNLIKIPGSEEKFAMKTVVWYNP